MSEERKSRYELFLEEEARKAQPTKRCYKCELTKALTDFYKDVSQKDRATRACRQCLGRLRKKKYRNRNDWFWKTLHQKTERVGDCDEWQGRYNISGIPIRNFDGKTVSLRRLVYKLSLGDVPDDMFVVPTCNNIRCIRQSHLKLATSEEVDIRLRNRAPTGDKHSSCTHPELLPRGERHHKATLTEEEVRAIRNLYTGERGNVGELARQFNANYNTVYDIVANKTWKHVQ